VTPPVRRAAVKALETEKDCSERHGCGLVGIARSTARYTPEPVSEEEKELRRRIKALADRHKRYGYLRVTELLRREDTVVNEKHVHRIWKEEGLQVPRRKARKRFRGPKGEVLCRAGHKDHVWSYDIVEDRTVSGGKIRFLTVVDEYTRESLAIHAGRSIGAKDVLSVLDWLFMTRGVPGHIRSDNGPEFIAKAVRGWLEGKSDTIYIEPGSPWENPYIESFNGKFRDECLNMNLFMSVRDSEEIAEAWREEYNRYRPHSALGYETPAAFAARAVSSVSPTASLRLQHENYTKQLDPLIVTGT